MSGILYDSNNIWKQFFLIFSVLLLHCLVCLHIFSSQHQPSLELTGIDEVNTLLQTFPWWSPVSDSRWFRSACRDYPSSITQPPFLYFAFSLGLSCSSNQFSYRTWKDFNFIWNKTSNSTNLTAVFWTSLISSLPLDNERFQM